MADETVESVAIAIYETYTEDYREFTPNWNDLSVETKDAWRKVALAAISAYEEDGR
jgi:hypothetical protein